LPRTLVTGASSGFGRIIAQTFLARGWEVVATMRDPNSKQLPASDRLQVLSLDVTDPKSIENAMTAAGRIDALVNNAGVGMLNVLEGAEMAKVRELFDTNVFGTFAMTKAVLPQMRMRGAGVIVNISSSVTLKPFPALSIYSASKAALNAFTESLALEAALFGVRARLVLPGSAPTTDFGKNAVARMGIDIPEPYTAFVHDYLATLRSGSLVTTAEDVAEAVWLAATDETAPMMIPAGADAQALFESERQSAK
jgi:NAD(P)-dependent dehydrogenase (short-subunit alcohol dehydrogenase family)